MRLLLIGCLLNTCVAVAATNSSAGAPTWLTQPLTVNDAIQAALTGNPGILRAEQDLEVAHGVAIQTRAIVLPTVRGSASYEHDETAEAARRNPVTGRRAFAEPEDEWSGSIRLIQRIYYGGRLRSALRAARVTRQQALMAYQAEVANTILEVRTAYYDALLAEQEAVVRQASLNLLLEELENSRRQFDAGAVPRFNVLRSEVEVANARPRLIRARNRHRIAKSNLGTLLGYNIPTNIWEDIPLTLTTKLEPTTFEVDLPAALTHARLRRPELGVAMAEIDLRKEDVIRAKAGNRPEVSAYAGYGARNPEFRDEFFDEVSGLMGGVRMTWNFFDGLETQGRVMEAKARQEKAEIGLDGSLRQIEQQVRTAYSSFVEAREVLESQRKVVEKAEETIRLAVSRYDAGSGTQLDVLTAQTALTDARTTQIEAARDFLVAQARLERAIGLDVSRRTAEPAESGLSNPPQQRTP